MELGGPSENGHYHLEGVELPKRILQSNILLERFKDLPGFVDGESYHDSLTRGLDFLIDGTDIPVADDSLGMVVASHMPHTPYAEVEEYADDDLYRAKEAIHQAAVGGVVAENHLDASLRLRVAKEVYRALEPGGLFLTDGENDDLHALMAFGFTVRSVASTVYYDGDRYHYVVLQKQDPSDTLQ